MFFMQSTNVVYTAGVTASIHNLLPKGNVEQAQAYRQGKTRQKLKPENIKQRPG